MRRLPLYALSLTIVFSQVTAFAQTVPAPNALVRVYAAQSKTSSVEIFAPGDTTPKDTHDYFSGQTIVYSADGKWLGGYGLQEGSTTPQVTYGQQGQTPLQIDLPAQATPIRIVFSPDSRYFAYTLLVFTTQQWTMGIVDLASGKRVQFAGKSSPGPVVGDATPDLNVVQGMALPLSWSPDGKRIFVESFIFSMAAPRRFDGLYSLEVSALDFAKSDPTPLPQTTRLLQDEQMFGEPLISPDGTKALYLSNDAKNAPENYAPTKFSQTANTLTVADLETGKTSVVAQADKGQGIAASQWTPDSKSILYATGGFQKTSYIVDQHGFLLDLASGKAQEIGIFESDPSAYLVNVLVCADHVFFVSKLYRDDFSGDATLYSASLSDLKSRSAALIVAQNITLIRCVSSITT